MGHIKQFDFSIIKVDVAFKIISRNYLNNCFHLLTTLVDRFSSMKIYLGPTPSFLKVPLDEFLTMLELILIAFQGESLVLRQIH